MNEDEFYIHDGHYFGHLNMRYIVWRARQAATTKQQSEMYSRIFNAVMAMYRDDSDNELLRKAYEAEKRAGRLE